MSSNIYLFIYYAKGKNVMQTNRLADVQLRHFSQKCRGWTSASLLVWIISVI